MTAAAAAPSKRRTEDPNGKVTLNHLLKDSPPMSDEAEEELLLEAHPKSLHNGDPDEPAPKAARSFREPFDERFDKRQRPASSQGTDGEALGEERYAAHKSAAMARREMSFEELDRQPSGVAKPPSAPSLMPPLRRSSNREMFTETDSPPLSLRKPEPKVNVRMDFLADGSIG